MKLYNIYYKGQKLNKYPISKGDAEGIINKGTHTIITNNKEEVVTFIPEEAILVVCTVV